MGELRRTTKKELFFEFLAFFFFYTAIPHTLTHLLSYHLKIKPNTHPLPSEISHGLKCRARAR